MIILLDGNVWEKMAEPFFKGVPQSGTLIFEGHLLDERYWHWVKDLSGKKLLGRAEMTPLIQAKINEVDQRYIKLTGFPSRHILKRTFLMFSKEPNSITVGKTRVVEAEKYWCPSCLSTNLEFLKKNISGNRLPFGCFDCREEFYAEDLEQDSPPWIKHPKLEKRYCREEIKRIPSNQQAVLAIAGEEWKLY